MNQSYQQQVDKDHYSFDKYYFKERWMSYWYETKEVLAVDGASSMLDVGPGSDLLQNILAVFAPTLDYQTADIAPDVKPDIVGSVTSLPVPDNSYDIVSVFQVLEHIEYDDVETALCELKRVARRRVLVSVPHFGPSVELLLKVPFLSRIKLAGKIPFPKKHTFGGQHYWELGKRGYSPRRFRALLQRHFTIVNEYVPFEYQYHRFYILDV